ncbi:Hypothetical predicted protein [Paramuricea clavata]|uniref:Aminopeptidase NAALADL1 n=1 Tax=Paramuricea clavata TaxID=317549 RepID=A0A6S7H6Q9_PARCT|nr:Hypothetical predicted protein [Paramuricea clavata]
MPITNTNTNTISIITITTPSPQPPSSPIHISSSFEGWRPRRTIKFCSWGAEEAGLIGSTEWVEENERALSTKAVAYINVDVAVFGNLTLELAGSPLLKTPIAESVKQVNDPHGGSVYDQIVKEYKTFDYGTLGSNSDYASFYQFVGVPSLCMYYTGEELYPVYHTVHDTYKWLQGLIDPKFEYHLTTTKVASKILLSTADSLVLPLDVTEYGKSLDSSLKALKKEYGAELLKNNVSLEYIEDAIKKFRNEATKFQAEKGKAIDEKDDIKLRALNDRMVNVEKAFITAPGLPNQPIIRHVIFAVNYASVNFPGIRDLVFKQNKTDQDWLDIKKQASIVFKAISEATDTLKADAN